MPAAGLGLELVSSLQPWCGGVQPQQIEESGNPQGGRTTWQRRPIQISDVRAVGFLLGSSLALVDGLKRPSQLGTEMVLGDRFVFGPTVFGPHQRPPRNRSTQEVPSSPYTWPSPRSLHPAAGGTTKMGPHYSMRPVRIGSSRDTTALPLSGQVLSREVGGVQWFHWRLTRHHIRALL